MITIKTLRDAAIQVVEDEKLDNSVGDKPSLLILVFNDDALLDMIQKRIQNRVLDIQLFRYRDHTMLAGYVKNQVQCRDVIDKTKAIGRKLFKELAKEPFRKGLMLDAFDYERCGIRQSMTVRNVHRGDQKALEHQINKECRRLDEALDEEQALAAFKRHVRKYEAQDLKRDLANILARHWEGFGGSEQCYETVSRCIDLICYEIRDLFTLNLRDEELWAPLTFLYLQTGAVVNGEESEDWVVTDSESQFTSLVNAREGLNERIWARTPVVADFLRKQAPECCPKGLRDDSFAGQYPEKLDDPFPGPAIGSTRDFLRSALSPGNVYNHIMGREVDAHQVLAESLIHYTVWLTMSKWEFDFKNKLFELSDEGPDEEIFSRLLNALEESKPAMLKQGAFELWQKMSEGRLNATLH